MIRSLITGRNSGFLNDLYSYPIERIYELHVKGYSSTAIKKECKLKNEVVIAALKRSFLNPVQTNAVYKAFSYALENDRNGSLNQVFKIAVNDFRYCAGITQFSCDIAVIEVLYRKNLLHLAINKDGPFFKEEKEVIPLNNNFDIETFFNNLVPLKENLIKAKKDGAKIEFNIKIEF